MYILYIIQADPSLYCTLVESVPCSTDAREAQKDLRAICKPDNDYSFPQKCEIMERVGRQTFNLPQTKMSFRSRMTILSMLDKIIMMLDSAVDQMYIISEVGEMIRQIVYIRKWIKNIVDSVDSETLPIYIKCLYAELLCHKTLHVYVIHLTLNQHIAVLRNQTRQNNRRPTHLEDEESIQKCPGLKEKLASSTKTLVEQTADDSCSVCMEREISKTENFAILDNCVHLFCQNCIKKWFTKA